MLEDKNNSLNIKKCVNIILEIINKEFLEIFPVSKVFSISDNTER